MTTMSHTRCVVLWLVSTIVVVLMMFTYRTSTEGALGHGGPRMPVIAAAGGQGATTPSAGSSESTKAAAPVTGDPAGTPYGPVQVQLTTSGSSISKISMLQYPNGDGRSQEISSYALPRLIQETLDQQTAQVDMVSGATYTSAGYQQSLQSALDRARP